MSGLLKKFRGIKADRLNEQLASTRPGANGLTGSQSITGIAPGDPGSNRVTPNRRPGRRGADTPLGPKGGHRV